MSMAAYQARQDYNSTGSNCNPYNKRSASWCDYEVEFQRIWAESQGINYGS